MNERESCISMCVEPLLNWFAVNRRELPFRINPSPYHTWISEIMLQQTRMEAVLPYYERFIAELPNVAALAACDPDRLNKLWQGLGYYSRARNLQSAAKKIVSDFNGEIPRTKAQLLTLPGIGDYTASAIASIACGERVAAVDGNVLRVVARLLRLSCDVKTANAKKEVGTLLSAVLPQNAGDFNQAMMELGALVCLPNGAPLCEVCPLSPFCQAKQHGDVESYPVRSRNKDRRIERLTVFLLRYQDRFALVKRPEKGLLAGLWQFPDLPEAMSCLQAETAIKAQGAAVSNLRRVGSSKHIFTHIVWEMRWYEGELTEECPHYTFVTKEELAQTYSVPSAFSFGIRHIRLP